MKEMDKDYDYTCPMNLMNKNYDYTCPAEGCVHPADFNLTGINQNEIVVGPTGGGKTMSVAMPRLVYTYNSSLIVPIAKRALKLKFCRTFIKRGYEVIDMDFSDPSESNCGYDPMDFIHSKEDAVNTANNLIDEEEYKNSSADPYWNKAAISILAGIIMLEKLIAADAGRRPSFVNVIKMLNNLSYETDDLFESNLDPLFEEAERNYPGNDASELWKTITSLSVKTASCIISTVRNSVDKLFGIETIEMMSKEKRISFKEMGERKMVLFLTTSPVNKALQNLVNLMYSDMFKELFETAEKNVGNRLRIPVHIVCDDFACGCRIKGFEDYISIFRAAGISVTLLLQSESQLNSMYGEQAATTIINNCDTYVYMGGMDITTCKSISVRIDKPVHKVMQLPLEHVIVFRRGAEPFYGRRYQILDDPEYRKIIEDENTK